MTFCLLQQNNCVFFVVKSVFRTFDSFKLTNHLLKNKSKYDRFYKSPNT